MTVSLISLLLPVYNQADHIGDIVREYEQTLSRVPNPYEIILVVGPSWDQSSEVCRALADQSTFVRVIQCPKAGWGTAVKLGLQEARGDLLCYTNSARTAPQDLLLLLLYSIANPGVVVKANRKIRDSWWRRLGSLIYNLECRSLFDLANWDINGTPKVFPRSFDKLFALDRDDDLLDVQFHIVCRREGYAILEVPILSNHRHGGKSTTNLRSAIRMYWGAYQLYQRIRKENG